MILGLDIGGANLKAAHLDGTARLRPFELWKNPAGLVNALRDLLRTMPPFNRLAVTMTGELCDCFPTRREGVLAILDAVDAVAEGRPAGVWRTEGRLVEPKEARAKPLLVASANWLALATYAGRFAPKGPALLIDIGSTTTDVVPLHDGLPIPRGRTDSERLRSGELRYLGVRRTPLCALLGSEAAAELFATTLDAYLLLDWAPENPDDRGTADGRPATRAHAHTRMARMLCADSETCKPAETRKLAERVLLKQVYHVNSAIKQVAKTLPGPPQTIIATGSGEFLMPVILSAQNPFPLDMPPGRAISLAGQLGPEISQAACAYAVAMLASEQARGHA
jgi:(4-(4-[2-(gamma-L-glutamylamino)ethyl]phenoxymethyl)furan-2-yl)methanamine synthase